MKLKLSLLAAVGALALATGAQAADRPMGLTFNVGASTDYVFRGISQTDEDPQIFGGADISFAGMGYAGVWASNVDFGDGTDAEFDLYAGVKPTLGPVALDFGAIYYGYVDDNGDWDYWEFKAAGSLPLGPGAVGAAVYYTPDATGVSKTDGWYYEVNGSVTIPQTKFSLSGAVGRQTFDDDYVDYTTWNLGVGYAVTENLGLDLRYWDTSKEGTLGPLAGDRFVAGFKASF
jgi:uncharacterized protein (TIGR02001 family)